MAHPSCQVLPPALPRVLARSLPARSTSDSALRRRTMRSASGAPGGASCGTGSGAGFGAHVSLADLGAQEWRVVGDVAADEVAAVAGAITPVPGGVGPMTIAALLDNVLHAWTRAEADLVARTTL